MKIKGIHVLLISIGLLGLMIWGYISATSQTTDNIEIANTKDKINTIVTDTTISSEVKNTPETIAPVTEVKKEVTIPKTEKIVKPVNSTSKTTTKNSAVFLNYNTLASIDAKIIYALKNIVNSKSNVSKTEAKLIAADIYSNLSNNFPQKNEIPKYSFCCSGKENVLNFLKNNGYNTTQIEENYKKNCP